MGFWHGVEYYEKERMVGEEFFQQWAPVSKDITFTYINVVVSHLIVHDLTNNF